jgi:two-component system response regulator
MRLDAARTARVLLVDDEETDVKLTVATLEAARIAVDLHTESSGERALEVLRDLRLFTDGSGRGRLPDLILLDVKMPGMNGLETLQAIKSDARLQHIPVVMLSSSTHDEDILRSYAEQAHAYLTKPIQVESFRAVMRRLDNFYFMLAVIARP